MSIGEVSRKSGVTVQAIRFYERRGLIPKALRMKSGYRQFSPEMIRRLQFIKRAKRLGFTLKEVDQFLALTDEVATDCREIQGLAKEKINQLEQKLRELSRLKDVLVEGVRRCPGEGPISVCPIIDVFSGGDKDA
ncbi:MAG: MerR family transcriptional regulator [Desulfobacteraceae bacterium]|jgi:MerR family mercuric resistance operon transcriptional regulator